MNKYELITKDILENKYFQENLTMQQIADLFGVTYKYIFYKMKSCGIVNKPRYNDLTNQKFTYLSVIELDKEKTKENNGHAFWKCRCDCGIIRSFRATALKNGHAKSCSCRKYKRYEQISGGYWARIKAGAAERNLEFHITIQYVWELFLKQDKRCALSGINLILTLKNENRNNTASLDRIDSSKGYIEGNVQWIHKDLNWMKCNMREDKFFYWIKNIYEHKGLDKI